MNRTKYSTRCDHCPENIEFDTCAEAEAEARELSAFGDVTVVKIVEVGHYKKRPKLSGI